MKSFVGLAVAVIVAVGLGVGLLAAPGRASAGTPTATGPAAFARSVLAEAPLPPGSAPVRAVALPGPASGRPGVSGLVDLHRFYTVRLPPVEVTTWVLAHLPSGARKEATSTFGGPTGTGTGFVVQLTPKSQNAYLAELAYTLVLGRGGSILRLDAESVWVATPPPLERVPRDAAVRVIGYAEVSLPRASSGAVSVPLSRSETARLLATHDRLPPAAQVTCMEDAVAYRAALVVPGRRYVVTGNECANTVEVSVNGHPLPPLHDASCHLLRLVGALVPARAVGTRMAAARCLPAGRSATRAF